MQGAFSLLEQLGHIFAQKLYGISLATMTTLVAIYGAEINQAIRARIQGFNLLLRTAVFITLCAFGYGWLILQATPLLRRLLSMTPRIWLPLVVIGMFLALGLLAQGKRKI